MGKPVAIDVIPYVPYSKMKSCDLGSISKSLEGVTKKLEILTRGTKAENGSNGAAVVYGDKRHVEPPGLHQSELQLKLGRLNSSPALRGRGITSMLPSFSGENSRTFISWLYDVECYFEREYFSDGKKCELVVSCLKSSALLWYTTQNFSRRMEGKDNIRSWLKLEKSMRLKFLPCSTIDGLLTELKSLRQNSLSVHEYAKLFEELHFVCDKEVDSVQKGVRFCHGLKSEIARRISLEMMYSYGELLELALCIEKSLARPRNHEVLVRTDNLEAIKTVGKERGLDQGVVEPCLNDVHLESKFIEPKSMEVLSYGEKDVSHVPLPPLEEEQAGIKLVNVHGAAQENDGAVQSLCLSTYMSPLELYMSKRLQEPLRPKMDQFLPLRNDKRCWSSSKVKGAKLKLVFMDIVCVPRHSGIETSTFEVEARLIFRSQESIMVFDPGGRDVIKTDPLINQKCEEFFFLHSKFEVKFFEPWVDATIVETWVLHFSLQEWVLHIFQGPYLSHKSRRRRMTSDGKQNINVRELNALLKITAARVSLFALHLRPYSVESGETDALRRLMILANYELWNETKSYFILGEMQFTSETGESEMH